jgi:hypothetical protein
MFCPRCRTEYREGFTECADCAVALVATLPPDPHEDSLGEWVEVTSLFDTTQVALATSTLQAAEVDFYLHGGQTQSIVPMTDGVRLMVREGDLEEARAILEELGFA